MKSIIILTTLLFFLVGCGTLPLRPGYSKVSDAGATVRQSQNPQEGSRQVYEKTVETVPGTNDSRTVTRSTERVETTIGAAQKDTARELGAKLGALKGVVWVGVLVFLFGAASAIYPPLKLVVGSVTTSAVIAASGIALIILPSLVVGHEILILGVSAGVCGLYWFAHRHGSLRGALDTLKAEATDVLDGKDHLPPNP